MLDYPTTRVQYKVATICYNRSTASCPSYLSSLLQLYTPSRQLRSSADTRILRIPQVKSKTLGQRALLYHGPVTWNSLPAHVRHAESADSFKTALKSHFF
ncbi:hypothetical protein BaRGS_00031907 [Batillaria attramentaria]|uniref:Uncharacterized protein n=1 Tax=Batillaria attramentaria TaxID=370345 RepID=A0ABD0JP64_9CAEN